ncbi:MAG: phospholipase, partial [Frankiales bacterium]|nr:phospholipase [Frankiales bacterium]
MTLTRRQLLGSAAGLGAAAAFGPGAVAALAGSGPRSAAYAPLPEPAKSGLDHIVVVCMENRSFDHYLGWLP